ncbi:MAG: alginate lyase family protein [Gemmatimonadaceae bacterium]
MRDVNRAGLSDAEYLERERAGNTEAQPILPGETYTVPASTPVAVRAALDDVFAHRFDVLGSGPAEVRAKNDASADRWRARFAELASDLPGDAIKDYRPIDWHSDFVAGYRWDDRVYYLDIPLAPQFGVDIKRPRELSRFQHVGVLAAAGRRDGDHDRAAIEFALETLDWIAANPVRRGVNWASAMDVSIRAVSWIWGLRFFDDVLRDFPRARGQIVRSLYEHGLHVQENLDYAREGTNNHYLADVTGLLFLGAALPQFRESDRWLHLGLQELVSEIDRQFHPDGSSREASTSYHRLCAEMAFSAAALAERLPAERLGAVRHRREESLTLGPRLRSLAMRDIGSLDRETVLPARVYERLSRVAEFTSALTKANGRVPQIGDNDSGRLHKLSPGVHESVCDHRAVLAVAGKMLARGDFVTLGKAWNDEATLIVGPEPALPTRDSPPARSDNPRVFPDFGVAVARSGVAYLAVTCGSNGLDGRGGHGHNDKGSFELAIGEQDIVVDGGSFVYVPDPDTRNRFRSTQAHSTVWVSGREQDPLPLGREGLFSLPEKCFRALTVNDDNHIVAEHDGFGAVHRRRFALGDQQLVIEDSFAESGERLIGFNLDPSVTALIVSHQDGLAFVLKTELGPTVRLTIVGAVAPRIDDGHFSAGYGVRIRNQRIVATLAGTSVLSRFDWSRDA